MKLYKTIAKIFSGLYEEIQLSRRYDVGRDKALIVNLENQIMAVVVKYMKPSGRIGNVEFDFDRSTPNHLRFIVSILVTVSGVGMVSKHCCSVEASLAEGIEVHISTNNLSDVTAPLRVYLKGHALTDVMSRREKSASGP
jgi:hypothetical protein